MIYLLFGLILRIKVFEKIKNFIFLKYKFQGCQIIKIFNLINPRATEDEYQFIMIN